MSVFDRLSDAYPGLRDLSAQTRTDPSLLGRSDPQGWRGMPEGQPRVCASCGERVTLGHEPVWFKTSEPVASWHFRCKWGNE